MGNRNRDIEIGRDFFREMIAFKMRRGELSLFGWSEDVWDFEVDSAERVVLDLLDGEAGWAVGCSSEGGGGAPSREGRECKRSFFFLEEDIWEYVSFRRDSILAGLGI